mgnify:CR=1 FL=1|jgi:uncharacterized protein YabN with tetrapyrrole methylase and pyrophosphatase domain
MKYEELSELVVKWGEDKGIFAKSTPLRQLDKTQEELNETKLALTKIANLNNALADQGLFPELTKEEDNSADLYEGYRAEVEDGIGDMLVTIILLAKMVDMDSVACLQSAYDVIKKRTGKMINGQFVKDQ